MHFLFQVWFICFLTLGGATEDAVPSELCGGDIIQRVIGEQNFMYALTADCKFAIARNWEKTPFEFVSSLEHGWNSSDCWMENADFSLGSVNGTPTLAVFYETNSSLHYSLVPIHAIDHNQDSMVFQDKIDASKGHPISTPLANATLFDCGFSNADSEIITCVHFSDLSSFLSISRFEIINGTLQLPEKRGHIELPSPPSFLTVNTTTSLSQVVVGFQDKQSTFSLDPLTLSVTQTHSSPIEGFPGVDHMSMLTPSHHMGRIPVGKHHLFHLTAKVEKEKEKGGEKEQTSSFSSACVLASPSSLGLRVKWIVGEQMERLVSPRSLDPVEWTTVSSTIASTVSTLPSTLTSISSTRQPATDVTSTDQPANKRAKSTVEKKKKQEKEKEERKKGDRGFAERHWLWACCMAIGTSAMLGWIILFALTCKTSPKYAPVRSCDGKSTNSR